MANFITLKLRFIAAYLQYRFRAQNRHGLHSPFVYTLLDGVIYDFTPYLEYPALQAAAYQLPGFHHFPVRANCLTYRLAKHFNPGTFHISPNVNSATALYLQAALTGAKQVLANAASIDLLVTDATNPDINYQSLNPQSTLLITNIYSNAAAKANWQAIKQRSEVTVTINMFWLGLVFFRAGQAKEHFTLKF